MTSLALLPTLKRTITDVMDEDLYHLPNSPIQFTQGVGFGGNPPPMAPGGNQGFGGAGAQEIHQSREDSPKPMWNRSASAQSSPSLSNSQMYGANSLFSNSGVADNFSEQYSKYNNMNNLGVETSNNSYGDMYYEDGTENLQNKVNPFNDYGNPDTQINSFIKPQEIVMPAPMNRRGRVFTLETPESYTKPFKDEDYLLFNPDIQPSQLINSGSFFDESNDGSMFIPNEVNNIVSGPIPGFENDYLIMDDFDEEVEADLSDDDDDDNYFNDDGEFDDLIMHDNAVMDIDNYFAPNDKKEKEELCGGFLDDYRGSEEDFGSANSEMSYKSEASMVMDDTPDTDEMPSMEKESPDSFIEDRQDGLHYKTAAEISALNPNHQCELINPATGHPCNKQFSRPYDLIRHQETIHAEKKKIFRCVICEGRANGGPGNGKSKTFSRGDALSRHIKVKHGLVGREALDLINEAKANVEYVHV